MASFCPSGVIQAQYSSRCLHIQLDRLSLYLILFAMVLPCSSMKNAFLFPSIRLNQHLAILAVCTAPKVTVIEVQVERRHQLLECPLQDLCLCCLLTDPGFLRSRSYQTKHGEAQPMHLVLPECCLLIPQQTSRSSACCGQTVAFARKIYYSLDPAHFLFPHRIHEAS